FLLTFFFPLFSVSGIGRALRLASSRLALQRRRIAVTAAISTASRANKLGLLLFLELNYFCRAGHAMPRRLRAAASIASVGVLPAGRAPVTVLDLSQASIADCR